MKAFLFPGQGTQKAGMYSLLTGKEAEVDEVFKIASEATGKDVLSLCRDCTDEELKQTANTQLSVTAMNMAYLRLLENRGIKPDIVAGHSLGQLSAVAAAGCISLYDLFRIVGKRAELMGQLKESGKLATILGLDREVIYKVCEEVSKEVGKVQVALENATQQTVIGGKEEEVNAAVERLKEAGALRIVEIKVSNAFHTYMMEPMVEPFAEFVKSIEFKAPQTRILLNAKGNFADNESEIKTDLINQCTNVVKWCDCMNLLLKEKDIKIAETGVGRTMASMIKGIDRGVKVYLMSNNVDFEQFITEG
ncbi:ACP S-malonyltransferase [Butyrivibrio sp. YAB3001]|uniref:ACP S-malonyltransferase n=1 Tax=Butyrivibrio sp. YAB3001 TaxID=1520812 RepID=UPI0008F67188|nr:ACP S-malonyltransferase [Butyrivibrio sp. YAB3001]SFC13167.1 [acyl-carrier-protein] S-malonyltransferase [Butyrivibrio sp. YAB3001]